tara:strand:- start:684 stop:1358 length:675 start_codon:yes stop_codon:yes gene_type:complete
MTKYPRAIIFDLDGTLIDSVPAIRETLNNIFSSEGVAEFSIEEVKTLVGFGARWMIEEIIKRKKIESSVSNLEALLSQYYTEYLRVSDKFTKIYDGVFEVLNELKEKQIKTAICTNKPGSTTIAVLKSLKLIEFFDAIVTEDDVKHRKPDPTHLNHTLTKIKAKPNESVFVGDSETDMETASRAGVKFVFVTYGYCHIPISNIKATRIIEKFNDLPKALKFLSD